MDLAYVCEWERRPKSNHCPSIPLVCAWSCRNLIAFTTDLRNEEEKGAGGGGGARWEAARGKHLTGSAAWRGCRDMSWATRYVVGKINTA